MSSPLKYLSAQQEGWRVSLLTHGGGYGANPLMIPTAGSMDGGWDGRAVQIDGLWYQPGIHQSEVNYPASTYMIMDSGQYIAIPYGGTQSMVHASSNGYLPGAGQFNTEDQPNDAYMDDYMNGRHFLGVNVNYADGHAKWVKSTDVYQEAKSCGGNCLWRKARKPTSTSAFNPWSPNQPQ